MEEISSNALIQMEDIIIIILHKVWSWWWDWSCSGCL